MTVLICESSSGEREVLGRVELRDGKVTADDAARRVLDGHAVVEPNTGRRLTADDGPAYLAALPYNLAGTYLWAEIEGRNLHGVAYADALAAIAEGAGDRERVVGFWDDLTARWLAGEDPMPAPLKEWWEAYAGRGRGVVTRDAFAEPYGGRLDATSPFVALGLNPGPADLAFQARGGVFAQQISQLGSYSAWAATDPYGSSEWEAAHGPNRYRSARLRFAREWLDEPTLSGERLVTFELYPWHSDSVTAAMRPSPDIINDFVWKPLSEVAAHEIFAFGRPWLDFAERLRLEPVGYWPPGGGTFTSSVRGAAAFGLPSGQRLVVGWQQGSAGPPGRADTVRLREALG